MSIAGRQIDLIATRLETLAFQPETWIVEVTTERVDSAKGSADYQKLALARQTEYPGARLMIVSLGGFTDDQRATLKKLGVIPLTFSELEKSTLNLHHYATASLNELRIDAKPDIGYDPTRYIDPALEIQANGSARTTSAFEWTSEFLSGTSPVVYALLGSLGTGKTSLLEHIHLSACRRFVQDPDNLPLTLLVPLGRFKQHSGDIEQMLMSVFRRYGMVNFPVAYLKHLMALRRVILLLDGLDEIHPIQNTDDVLSTVIQILDQLGSQCRAILSSRREFFASSKEEIAYFGAYTAPKIEDLQTRLSRELRGHPTTQIIVIQPFDRPRIDAYLERRCRMDESAVRKFFQQFYGFADMARTPVLLSMMATAIEQNLIDPAERYQFPLLALYEKYTDRWIERDRDRAKLNSSQRRALSDGLADHMIWAGADSESWAYVLNVLRAHPVWRENPISEDEAALDIRRSGFLMRDIDDRYRFNHRSIQEFFAARVEFDRLRFGARPRHIPTDGFRMFLSSMIADAWLREGFTPIALDQSHHGTSELANAQAALLASASASLPEGVRVSLQNQKQLKTRGDFFWKRVRFTNCNLDHEGEDVQFDECEFEKCNISISKFKEPAIVRCKFTGSTVSFDEMPTWGEAHWFFDSAQGARLNLPGYIWDLSALVDDGAKVIVKGVHWTLSWDELVICAEVFGRLRGKMLTRDVISGPRTDDLKLIIPRLIGRGWIAEDTSREEKSIELTAHARAMLGKLRVDPLGAQAEFAGFATV